MTRINIVPPSELMDQHLVAEYREIFMILPALKRSLNSKNGFDKNRIPKRYTLDKGHMMFFYDKGLYLDYRYNLIRNEMLIRGMNPDKNRIFPSNNWPLEYYNDWTPEEDDYIIIRKRLEQRIAEKPNWYRYYGKIV